MTFSDIPVTGKTRASKITVPYQVEMLGIIEYLLYELKNVGLKKLFKLTDSMYPRIFATGYCSHTYQTIVICKIGNWRLRLAHEIGHELGYGHLDTISNVMHPWGVLRDETYAAEILEEYYKKYGILMDNDVVTELIEIYYPEYLDEYFNGTRNNDGDDD